MHAHASRTCPSTRRPPTRQPSHHGWYEPVGLHTCLARRARSVGLELGVLPSLAIVPLSVGLTRSYTYSITSI